MGANDKHAATFHPYQDGPTATGPEVHYHVPPAAEPEPAADPTRLQALEFAVRITEAHKDLNFPGSFVLDMAPKLEKYLRDGATEED
jgi:hypothetical protein